jgi:hypothetical protein
MLNVELLVEWFAGETEVPEENPLQCRFVNHETHMISLELEPCSPLWEADD